MPTSPELEPVANLQWRNWHRTQSADAKRHVKLRPASGSLRPETFKQSADLVLDFIEEARQQGATIRTAGSNWSFSKVSAQKDCWILDTTPANRKARLGPSTLDSGFAGDPDSLLLAQCGTSIHELNQYLERERGRSLVSTGASNGQTIAGAIGTGSHGSAIKHGAIQSQVVAIQLLTAGGKNLWIEHPDRPIIAQSLAESFGATIRREADLFHAAVVSLGLLGVVHSVVIETAPRFLLHASQFKHPYDGTLKAAMRAVDPERLTMPAGVVPSTGNPEIYFFQVVVNPHDEDAPARVKVMYQTDWDDTHTIDYSQQGKYGVAYDLPGFVGSLLDVVDPLTPFVTSQIFDMQLKTFTGKKGTVGQMFNFTTPRSQTVGASLAVPASQCDRALDLAIEAHREFGPAPIAFACRFVQKSPGLIAFTRYDPSCVIDIDGLESGNTQLVMESVRRAFDEAGIPYAQHWGKYHNQTGGRLQASYGADLDTFLQVRDELLPTAQDKHTFSLAAAETVIGRL